MNSLSFKKPIHGILAALIGALYVALTMLVYPIAFTGLQFRVSEALTVIPYLFPPASWGLFLGCALSNIGSPLGWVDIVFGSLATLTAALLTSRIKSRWLAPLPPVLINAVVIGAVLYFASGQASPLVFFVFAGQVAAGQVVSCYGLGVPLLYALEKSGLFEKYALAAPKNTKGHRRESWMKK